MWRMLEFAWLFMVNIFKGSINIAFHGEVNIYFFVVPVKIEATLGFYFPVNCDFIGVLHRFNEMVGITF